MDTDELQYLGLPGSAMATRPVVVLPHALEFVCCRIRLWSRSSSSTRKTACRVAAAVPQALQGCMSGCCRHCVADLDGHTLSAFLAPLLGRIVLPIFTAECVQSSRNDVWVLCCSHIRLCCSGRAFLTISSWSVLKAVFVQVLCSASFVH